MRLSLSVRIAESSSRKDKAEMGLEELAPLARAAGFEGLSMRASALSIDTPPERVGQVRRLLDREGLAVSMVMGNVALAANTGDAPSCLRQIAPHLELAERLGATLVRVMLQTPADIPHAMIAADEAAKRGLSLAQQTHWGTLCETVEQSLELTKTVNRPNFGITFEPANLMACGSDYGPDAIARLAPILSNVYFQNVRLDPAGHHCFKTRLRGDVRVAYVPLEDPSGIEAAPLIEALNQAGYTGWFTVHQPLLAGQSVEMAITEAAMLFKPLIGSASNTAHAN